MCVCTYLPTNFTGNFFFFFFFSLSVFYYLTYLPTSTCSCSRQLELDLVFTLIRALRLLSPSPALPFVFSSTYLVALAVVTSFYSVSRFPLGIFKQLLHETPPFSRFGSLPFNNNNLS
ncbi:hypothetical protein F4775DRAFT_253760 [Biscogniauxia sp. FL1348]|nr:hypothetical protein F4775DRAFT_253760 [Biscogniauxia sp. FL1348]